MLRLYCTYWAGETAIGCDFLEAVRAVGFPAINQPINSPQFLCRRRFVLYLVVQERWQVMLVSSMMASPASMSLVIMYDCSAQAGQ
jgi:hypothetical protein